MRRNNMNTQKVAISMPKGLVAIIDTISKKNGISRSKFISSILYEKVMNEKNKEIRQAYDEIFSDKFLCFVRNYPACQRL